MSDILELASDLIRRASVTPEDAGCQALVAERLAAAGFTVERLGFGEVDNLWASHGRGGPTLCLLGHTDVVPPGPREQWTSDPFEPALRDGWLYGRGAADMKSSVAAFVLALEAFVAAHPDHPGTVALLITSDEEGDAIDGVRRVAQTFRERGTTIDYCLVGEPSSAERLGDVVKYFMVKLLGMPIVFWPMMRFSKMFNSIREAGRSLPFDMEAINGFNPPLGRLTRIAVPTLAMAGSKTMPVLIASTELCAR
ncbi:MAG: M20/M25/M40 family metallo-hydrolase, partial [Pseudomonas sp.]|nr:M20/M25/M40 family metallo-hydrolase [Pseudomonas sp.]